MLTGITAKAYNRQSLDINVNGQSRNMIVFTPSTMRDNMPLMIVTHGMNQNPEYQLDGDKLYEMIDTAKFVVTYLRSDGNTWDTGGTKDQNFVIKTIEEMQSRYNIDINRVYWSGFSMGSMLIFHCIAQMQDRIAAFAPTSGIQFSESPWNNCKKPVNLIEITSYKDDVFGYDQYNMHGYIENFAKHDQHPTYKKTPNYRPSPDCYYTGDLEQWSGGPNGGEVWMFSGSEGGHWPSSYNRLLIWNFCKRHSLDSGIPTITMSNPTVSDRYTSYDTIMVAVHAADADGSLRLLRIYIDGGLKATKALTDTPEYDMEYKWVKPRVGSHTIRVVATDNEGKTREFSRTITIIDLKPFINALNAALTEAKRLMAATEGEQYEACATIRTKIQDLIDKYDGTTSTSIDDIEQATQTLTDLTSQLSTRRDNLDQYFLITAQADSIISLYADNPVVSEMRQYQRLVTARNYYDLTPQQMMQDSRLEAAVRQLKVYINSFENATVGISQLTMSQSDEAGAWVDYITLDGRRIANPQGIVVRRIHHADGTVSTAKVVVTKP